MKHYVSKWDNMSARFKSGILYWLITLFVIIIYAQNLPPLQTLEYEIEDQIRSSKEFVPDHSKISVVAIDARSVDKVGKWPWDHGRISDLLITICDYKPKAVMLDFPLAERVEEFVSGNSGTLGISMKDCGNVVLPFDIVVSDEGRSSRPVPDYFQGSSILPSQGVTVEDLPRVVAAFVPPKVFAANVGAVGFRYFESDFDDLVRSANVLVNFEDKVFVSAPVQLANIYLGGTASEITFSDNGRVIVGGRELPTDQHGQMLVDLPAEGKTYPLVSAIDILTGDADKSAIAGKAVVIAATGLGDFEFIETATAGSIPSYQFSAALAQNLINGGTSERFDFPIPIDLLMIFAIGAFGGLVLPKMPQIYRLVALFIVGFILFNINFVLFSSMNMVLNVLYPTATVILFIVASILVKPNREYAVTSTITRSLDLKKLLNGEPLATRRDDGRELSFDEIIPGRFLEEDRPSPELLSETIRLDFEALRKGGDFIPASEMRKHDKTGKYSANNAVNETVREVQEDVASTEANDTKSFIPDLLDVDMSAITNELPPTSKKPAKVEEELILTDEEKKIYGVRFTTEGQPVSFGRYQVLEPLGKGAMGTVYKGKDPAIDRLVALKTIRLDTIADPSELSELKERLTREAKAAGNLSHPNIVTIYDVGLQGNLQYIAMEYIEGYTLEAVLKRNLQLNYRILASVIIQTCSALEYAHKMGIVHRDIKPANIMVMDGFKVKVMDFGIAHFESSSMTQTGVAMGTPNYISPEQLKGKEVSASSDIFSLGVVLYEMLTHRRPFTGDNISALVYKILNEEPTPASTIDPKVPPLFDMIIRKALAKDPQERYRSAKDFAAALEDFTVSFSRKPAMA